MMKTGEEIQIQRIQIMGRSLLINIAQFFKHAEIYSANNQVFTKLIQSFSANLKESFRHFNSCDIRVSDKNAYIGDRRIYIDMGLVESVIFLSELFERAEIDGISLFIDCLEPQILQQTLFTLRAVMVRDGAKGASAIRKGLADKHCPFLEPFPISRKPDLITGLRTEAQAEKFAQKNLLKFVLFLNQMEESLMEQRPLPANLVYRITLNLIRIGENYPNLIHSFLYVPLPFPRVRVNFYTSMVLLAAFRSLKADRQTQQDLIVDFLYHNYGELSLPTAAPPQTRKDLSNRGVAKLLETKYINRSFFYRMAFAYHMPLNLAKPYQLPLLNFFKTVKAFVESWKMPADGKPITAQQAFHKLFTAKAPNIDRHGLVLIALALGMLPIGSLMLLDGEKPAIITGFEDKDEVLTIKLTTAPLPGTKVTDAYRWELRSETDRIAYLHRLSPISGAEKQPNPYPVVFKNSVY